MKQEILTIFIAAVTITFVSLFWKDIMVLTASLSILSIIALWHYHKKNDVIIYLIGAIIGMVAESVCIYFGAWKYSNPTFLIPIWLPIVWGLVALVIRRFDLDIENR